MPDLTVGDLKNMAAWLESATVPMNAVQGRIIADLHGKILEILSGVANPPAVPVPPPPPETPKEQP